MAVILIRSQLFTVPLLRNSLDSRHSQNTAIGRNTGLCAPQHSEFTLCRRPRVEAESTVRQQRTDANRSGEASVGAGGIRHMPLAVQIEDCYG